MNDLPDFTGELVEHDFEAAEAEGQFIYGYVRQRNSEKYSFKARTLYYVGKASRAIRVTEKHNGVPVPKNKKFIQILKRGLTEEEANHWECYYIAKLGRIDKGTGILRNRTDGGEGVMGRLVSEDQKRRRNEALAVTAGKRYGLNAEEWKELQISDVTTISRTYESAKKYDYSLKEWIQLSEKDKQKIIKKQGLMAKTAEKYGFTHDEWLALGDTERKNMSTRQKIAKQNGYSLKEWLNLSNTEKASIGKQTQSTEKLNNSLKPKRQRTDGAKRTAEKNNYKLEEWQKFSNSEKQSIGKQSQTAKKAGIAVEEWMALTKSEKEIFKMQIKKAEKYGIEFSTWRSMSHEQQCKAAAINRARKAAANFDVPVETWIELTYLQREKIRDRYKRGRRVPELLEDL